MASIDEKRHTLAHLLASSVRDLYPGAKNAIGPAIDDGFYQDFALPASISESELPAIEAKMREKLADWESFTKKEVSADHARKEFEWNEYKTELINEFSEGGKSLTFYTVGGFVDLCKGGHAEHPSKDIAIDSFKLDRIAGAYWRGDEKRPMLTRIYGLAFDTKEELDAYEARREEAKKRDHRKIAKEQGLLVFSDLVGSGMPLFTPKGNIVRSAIINFSRELNSELGFGEVHTPNINKGELFKISGHYDKYKEDMLKVSSQYVDDEMFLKPMNCPQHTQIYAAEPRSYRDLPLRYADFAVLYRDERPGELSGLTRLRAFSQDDGHIFCREDQIEGEIAAVLSAIEKALKVYRIDYWMRLSLRDAAKKEKYLGTDEVWVKSEDIMRRLLIKMNIAHKEAEGEAAFYGPKIDIMAVDALGREWQISTIQLDFNQPARFKLTYRDSDGTDKTPTMIHRALVGSPDRFMGILIEHYAGAFPTWLSPVQAKILPVAENHNAYGALVLKTLKDAGIRAEIDDSNESLGKKTRAGKTSKIPYLLVVGDAEAAAESVAVESRDEGKVGVLPTADFITRVLEEIRVRK